MSKSTEKIQEEAIADFAVWVSKLPAPMGEEGGSLFSEEYRKGWESALRELTGDLGGLYWAMGGPKKRLDGFKKDILSAFRAWFEFLSAVVDEKNSAEFRR